MCTVAFRAGHLHNNSCFFAGLAVYLYPLSARIRDAHGWNEALGAALFAFCFW